MDRMLKFKDEERRAKLHYAGEGDFTFVSEWRAAGKNIKHPLCQDAVSFADLAVRRYKAHREFDAYAKSSGDIGVYVQDNPNREVANLMLLKTDWFEESEVLGLCHFRRTWSNNIVLDYLAVHPFVAMKDPKWPIKGAGLALLSFVAQQAISIEAKFLWGEATQNSCRFYQKVFQLDTVTDLILAPSENLHSFIKVVGP